MRRKLFSVALCATMVAGLFAGCGNSSSSDKSSAKGSVYWLNFKPEADEALQDIAKTYEKEKGVKVKVVTAASGNYNSTLTSEMGKSAAPTLFVVGNQAAVKTWDDYCIDLKDTDVYKELSTDAFNLTDADGKVYLEVEFDAPLFGIWSPAKKHAPFVCIEPWYGRSDREDFDHILENREWGNELEPGDIFEKDYKILVK